MSFILKDLYANMPDQACMYCGRTSKYRGWESLCDRSCYYGLSELLQMYENEKVNIPDQRIIAYFTKYPEPSHSFVFEKLKRHLTGV